MFFFFQIFGCFLCVFFFPVKVHMPFIQSISKLYFFFFVAGKKNTAFSFIQSIFPQNVKKMNFYSKKKIRYLWFKIFHPKHCTTPFSYKTTLPSSLLPRNTNICLCVCTYVYMGVFLGVENWYFTRFVKYGKKMKFTCYFGQKRGGGTRFLV